MKCSIHHEQCYEDRLFEAFELTIDGETRYFESPIQPALLELADGTVLDVEIIGDELHVDPNSTWLTDSGRDYEYFPASAHADPDDAPLSARLQRRGVSFCSARSQYQS